MINERKRKVGERQEIRIKTEQDNIPIGTIGRNVFTRI